MAISASSGLARLDFDSVGGVTPFTYRDGATYLTLLNEIISLVNQIVDVVNEDNNNVDGLMAEVNAKIKELDDRVSYTLAGFKNSISGWIKEMQDEKGSIYDPTNGTLANPFSVVMERIYDNVRIYAYFARQYDDLGLTAAEYDALEYTARHYDLGVTHPTLSDVLIGV